MAMHIGHVHIKTKEDPQKVAKFYVCVLPGSKS